MSNRKKLTKFSPLLFWGMVLLVLIGGALAWFTGSQRVHTNQATAKTNEDMLELYISSKGGSEFVDQNHVADLIQINEGNIENLMPVSTADLKVFLEAAKTTNGIASAFQKDENGKNYYHGRVYLKAVKTDVHEGERMDLYLDTSEGLPVVAKDGDEDILKATRLGMTFNETNPAVMFLNGERIQGATQTTGTLVDGKLLAEGQVITLTEAGKVQGVQDSSSDIKNYCLDSSSENITLPSKKLLSMEFGTIYTVDVYFYLEGCDLDCVGSVSLDQVDMQLNFYGVLGS